MLYELCRFQSNDLWFSSLSRGWFLCHQTIFCWIDQLPTSSRRFPAEVGIFRSYFGLLRALRKVRVRVCPNNQKQCFLGCAKTPTNIIKDHQRSGFPMFSMSDLRWTGSLAGPCWRVSIFSWRPPHSVGGATSKTGTNEKNKYIQVASGKQFHDCPINNGDFSSFPCI